MATLTILLHVADGLLQSVESSGPVNVLVFDEDALREQGVEDCDREAIHDHLCFQHQLTEQPAIVCSTKKRF